MFIDTTRWLRDADEQDRKMALQYRWRNQHETLYEGIVIVSMFVVAAAFVAATSTTLNAGDLTGRAVFLYLITAVALALHLALSGSQRHEKQYWKQRRDRIVTHHGNTRGDMPVDPLDQLARAAISLGKATDDSIRDLLDRNAWIVDDYLRGEDTGDNRNCRYEYLKLALVENPTELKTLARTIDQRAADAAKRMS